MNVEKFGITAYIFSIIVSSLFLPTRVFLSSDFTPQSSLSVMVSCCLSLTPLTSSTPFTPRFYLHASLTCIFLCGWWPQQALANVSSATSSSLQPLMMRKPLLRHWSRVCRQSNRLKHRPKPLGKTEDRQTEFVYSSVQRLTVLCFCFVVTAFFIYICLKRWFFVVVIEIISLFISGLSRINKTAMTKRDQTDEKEIKGLHVLTLYSTGTPCSMCSFLRLMTKATVGRELCKGFCGRCQDLTFGCAKSPDHQTALLIQILFTLFEDTTVTTASPEHWIIANKSLYFFRSLSLRRNFNIGLRDYNDAVTKQIQPR